MGNIWFEEEEGQLLEERYTLAISRVKEILQEQRVPADFVSYFHETARFLLLCDEVKTCLETGVYDSDPERMRTDNHALYQDILNNFTVTQGYYNYGGNTYYHLSPQQDAGWYIYDTDTGDWDDVWITDIPADLKHQNTATDFWYTPTWDESTQYSDFEQTEIYQDYKAEQERQAYEAAHDNDDSDDDYSWDSGDSWDSGSTDWDSDW